MESSSSVSECLDIISYILNNLPYDELSASASLELLSLILDEMPHSELEVTDELLNEYQSFILEKMATITWDEDGYPKDPILKKWHQIWETRLYISKIVKQRTGKRICEMLLNFPAGINTRYNKLLQNLLEYAKCLNEQNSLLKKQQELMEFINRLIDCYIKRADVVRKKRGQKKPEIPCNVELDLIGDRNCVLEQRTWIDSVYIRDNSERVVQHFPGIENLHVTGYGVPLQARPERHPPNSRFFF